MRKTSIKVITKSNNKRILIYNSKLYILNYYYSLKYNKANKVIAKVFYKKKYCNILYCIKKLKKSLTKYLAIYYIILYILYRYCSYYIYIFLLLLFFAICYIIIS